MQAGRVLGRTKVNEREEEKKKGVKRNEWKAMRKQRPITAGIVVIIEKNNKKI